tara:strand:- start:184 stop:885 length:702 start_codon:yes stop_codon:yes gene_type:complete
MKYLFFLLVFCSLSTFSQSLKPVEFSLKSGINIDNTLIKTKDGEIPSKHFIKIGYNAGLILRVPISKRLFILNELQYTLEECEHSYRYILHSTSSTTKNEYESKYSYSRNYIRLTPYLSFSTSDYLNINFGPSVGYLISNSYSLIESNDITSNENIIAANLNPDNEILNTFEDLDYGIKFSFDIIISNSFVVNPNYYFAINKFSEVNSTDQTIDAPAFKFKNSFFGLDFVYIF